MSVIRGPTKCTCLLVTDWLLPFACAFALQSPFRVGYNVKIYIARPTMITPKCSALEDLSFLGYTKLDCHLQKLYTFKTYVKTCVATFTTFDSLSGYNKNSHKNRSKFVRRERVRTTVHLSCTDRN